MTVTLDISPDTEAQLREKAARHGQDLPDYFLMLAEADVEEDTDLTDINAQIDLVETVIAVRAALADLDAGEKGMLLEDYRAEVEAKRRLRDTGVAA